MSFGHGISSKTHDFRALPLAVGALGLAKADALGKLRSLCLTALRRMGEAAFCTEPLLETLSKKELTARLIPIQKSVAGLNQAYAQCCRVSVVAAVAEQHSGYFRQLMGRLFNANSAIPEADQKADDAGLVRRYYYVPPEVTVSAAELTALVALADQPFKDVMALFRRVALDGDSTGLTVGQAAVVREIHRQVHAKLGRAEFGAESATVSLALPYMVLPTDDYDIATRIDAGIDTLLLRDEGNTKFCFFLDLSSPVPRAERIRLPLAVSRRALRHLLCDGAKMFTANSLTLQLGPDGAVGVTLVVTQPKKQPTPLTSVQYLLSRDFGYANTIALSLTKLEAELDIAQLADIQSFTKDQALAFLSSHAAQTEPHVAARYLFNGKPFLDRINVHAAKIDQLRSRIDIAYTAVFAQKLLLCQALGFVPDESGQLPLITRQSARRGHAQYQSVRDFLGLLSQIHSMKVTQRGLYSKIAALKKHWFGFLSNHEVALARTWNALVVREDLTVVTQEKDAPGYKGRAFNKMINHGSRGQYSRRASAKFLWNGVPEVALPSYYTSTTCYRHAVVHKSQRKGDKFSCKRCRAEGRGHEHADAHAADTLGAYLLLRPL
jgi:hypothetical protein